MAESDGATLGPPTAGVIRLTDFEAASAIFANWHGRFEQVSSGRFESELRIVRGGQLRIIGIEANQRVLIRGHDASGLVSFYPVTDRNAGDSWQGYRLTPGHVVANGVHAEVDHFSARRTATLGMSLRPNTLRDAARVLLKDEVALATTWNAVTPPADIFAGLNYYLASLLNLGVTDPTILGTSEGERLEQECIRSLVASLFTTSARPRDLSISARTQIVRRAEGFMRSRLRQPVGAIDLCRELGVSDRTLRLAFRERFGLGPMAYYRCLRLNAVRARLRTDSVIPVAAAAQEFGFHHLGNFSADYRRLFAERPSETNRDVAVRSI